MIDQNFWCGKIKTNSIDLIFLKLKILDVALVTAAVCLRRQWLNSLALV